MDDTLGSGAPVNWQALIGEISAARMRLDVEVPQTYPLTIPHLGADDEQLARGAAACFGGAALSASGRRRSRRRRVQVRRAPPDAPPDVVPADVGETGQEPWRTVTSVRAAVQLSGFVTSRTG